ncbi:Uncharacterised protein [Mycolicibacterium vanbaalenii]|uniref:Uncharacterized protein n=1 Tax=Mycolicibacterium vanbaalenii TaxID=110539 RepID=A0A5S9MYU0_MYCVN|nr:Uncharacterised protein [Mycolicibacterium vanbaalenii]
MAGLLKLRIGAVMEVLTCRQTRGLVLDGESARRRIPLVEPSVQSVQSVVHAVAGERAHIAGLGLVEELGNI